MTEYFAPFRVQEGPSASGNYRVEEQNTLKVVGEAPTREAAQRFARALNQTYTDFRNDGGWINYA